MNENNNLDVISISTQLQENAQEILNETDISKSKDLIALFNWNLSKKNVARLLKLNNLYDNITDQMVKRVENKPDQFSNSDLIDYMKAIQGAITTSTKDMSQPIEPPQIIQNNTQITINNTIDNFTRESRERILAAVQATLKAANDSQIEYEDKTEGDISNESV